MGSPRPVLADCGCSAGFALIIVLWTLVLIAFIFTQLTASGRTEIRIAGNLVANAQAEAALDGGVFQTIFNLSDAGPERRWPLDGTAHELAIGDSRVVVRVEDEAARINPNLASPALLEALLRAVGSDRDSAQRLVTAIREWIGTPMADRPKDAVRADYRAAGLDYEPPGAPLETIDELGRVLGMTPTVLAAIRPHLSLFGPAQPDASHADPLVSAILAAFAPGNPIAASRQNLHAPDFVTARITAEADGPGNARARVRHVAVVRVGAMLPSGYTILAWDSGLD
jgi:general secretion pathway protein K